MTANKGFEADEEIEQTIWYQGLANCDCGRKYASSLEALKHQELAKCLTTVNSRTSDVRASEATMGNFVADAVRQLFQTDVTIVQVFWRLNPTHSGRSDQRRQRLPGWHLHHSLRLEQARTSHPFNHQPREFPFPNVVTMYKLKGSDLRMGLAEGVRHLPNRAGCFPQISGTTRPQPSATRDEHESGHGKATDLRQDR